MKMPDDNGQLLFADMFPGYAEQLRFALEHRVQHSIMSRISSGYSAAHHDALVQEALFNLECSSRLERMTMAEVDEVLEPLRGNIDFPSGFRLWGPRPLYW